MVSVPGLFQWWIFFPSEKLKTKLAALVPSCYMRLTQRFYFSSLLPLSPPQPFLPAHCTYYSIILATIWVCHVQDISFIHFYKYFLVPDLSQAVLNSKLLQPALCTICNLPPLTQSLVVHPQFPGFSLYLLSLRALLKHHFFLQVLLEKGLIRVIYYAVGFKSLFYLSRCFYISAFPINVNEKVSQIWLPWASVGGIREAECPPLVPLKSYQMNGPPLFPPTFTLCVFPPTSIAMQLSLLPELPSGFSSTHILPTHPPQSFFCVCYHSFSS